MRVDDFKNALALAARELAQRDPAQTASLAGVKLEEGFFKFNFLYRPIKVSADDYVAAYAEAAPNEELSLTDSVLILHFLQGAKGLGNQEELVAYRQIPGGEFYFAAFRKRAEIPLVKVFGSAPGLLNKAALLLGGEVKGAMGDEAALFEVLPNLTVATILHHGDEEFEPEGQVLFNRNVALALSVEDAAWLGSGVVYRLMGLSKNLS
ncbi:MAG: DUF3786 domain-containing protein [Deltaproteobacteria bacterium]|jgi:hypothetical protein|nr:DUF3786 domain-containing protein [Deltaproteobacteria bacterium]